MMCEGDRDTVDGQYPRRAPPTVGLPACTGFSASQPVQVFAGPPTKGSPFEPNQVVMQMES